VYYLANKSDNEASILQQQHNIMSAEAFQIYLPNVKPQIRQ